jgi:hypothetical protein
MAKLHRGLEHRLETRNRELKAAAGKLFVARFTKVLHAARGTAC